VSTTKSFIYAVPLVLLLATAVFELGLSKWVDKLPVSLYASSSVLMAVAAGALLVFKRANTIYPHSLRPHRAVVGGIAFYWLASWIGCFYGPVQGAIAMAIFTVNIVQLWIAMLLLERFPARLQQKIVFLAGLLSLSVMLSLGGISFINGSPIALSSGTREGYAATPYADYNTYTYGLILSSMLVLSSARFGREMSARFVVAMLGLCAVLCGFGLVSGSRRTLTIVVPFLLLYLGVTILKRGLIKGGGAILVSIMMVLVVGFVFINGNTFDRFANRMELDFVDMLKVKAWRATGVFTGEYGSGSERTERWATALDVYKDYNFGEMLYGRGTRSFYEDPQINPTAGERDHPHNWALSALLEGGVLKLGLLGGVVATIYGRVFFGRRYCYGVAGRYAIVSLLALWFVYASISGVEFFASRHLLVTLFLFFCLSNWTVIQSRSRILEEGTQSSQI